MLPILPPVQVELSRGETVGGVAYWDVTDAALDERAPDTALGGEGTLGIGPSRTLLIRFGGLDRIVGRRKITRARIVFQQLSGGTTVLTWAGRVLVPWGEGPERTLAASLAPPPKDGKPLKPPVWAATWRERHAGKSSWQQAGARGASDSEPISTAISTDVNGKVEIDGLAAAVQRMTDHPLENNGFLLRFDTDADFGSAQAKEGSPRLVLDLEDVATTAVTRPDVSVEGISRDGDRYTATVRNVGSAEATFGGGWSADGKAVGDVVPTGKLAPGATATFSITRSTPKDSEPRTTPLTFSVAAVDDADARNDAACIYESGTFVDVSLSPEAAAKLGSDPAGWVQAQARTFNDGVLAQSRFSFAPEGAMPRLNVAHVTVGGPVEGAVRLEVGDLDYPVLMRRFLDKMSLPVAPNGVGSSSLTSEKSPDRFPGLRGFGDTRDDAQLPPRYAIPYEPYPDRLVDQNPPAPSGLLAASDVALLNGIAPEMPKITAIRAFDLLGRPISNQDIEIVTPDGTASLMKVKTSVAGSAVIAKPILKGWSDLAVAKATAYGETAYAYVKGWTLFDAYARGNREVAFLDLHFNLPSADLEKGTNFATDRVVSDSANHGPADLAAVVDGKPETSVALGAKAGDWIEIDLGKDRTIGELKLNGNLWNRFRAVGYGTGQSADDASPLVIESDYGWARANRGADGWTSYRTPAVRVRYVRLVAMADGGGTLNEISITPARVSP
ncbi:hypothetical protein BH11ARM2_BH11ARM2_01890 [soil metagenome]